MDYITLTQAKEKGYGNPRALRLAIKSGRLKAVKPGHDWLTTEKWLKETGYGPDNTDQAFSIISRDKNIQLKAINTRFKLTRLIKNSFPELIDKNINYAKLLRKIGTVKNSR